MKGEGLRPKGKVITHSDQGSQYGSQDWQDFFEVHGLSAGMNHRGNCYDNAVAESFFQLLKGEWVRKKIYNTRDQARADIFNFLRP